MSNEPTDQDWVLLSQAIADAEWTVNRARAMLQEAEGQLARLHWWQHPIICLKLWRYVHTLRHLIVP